MDRPSRPEHETHTRQPEPTELINQIEKLQDQINDLRASINQRLMPERVPSGSFVVFVCRVGDELIAVPIGAVEEVLPICELSSIPEAAPWLAGMLTLRGTMIPVVDVAARFAGARRDAGLDEFIVVCAAGDQRFGLVVQQVFTAQEADGSQLQVVPENMPLATFVLGLLKIGDQAVFLLSLSCLLASSEIPEDLW